MKVTLDEVGNQIFRISIQIPPDGIPVPGGFTFNQYLLVDDQPMLFHTGARPFFPLVKEAIEKVMPIRKLRYVGFSHYEQDECGALNEFLASAPEAVPVCSRVNAMINGAGMDRPPRSLVDGETLSLGKKTVRWIDAPHLPHAWDCGYLFEENTKTLLCGDLFTQPGSGMPAITEGDILSPSEAMRKSMDYFSHSANTSALLQKLSATNPRMLACMHGSAWLGDGAKLLRDLEGMLLSEL